MKQIRIMHVMDKVSVAGSKIHGPARQLAYRIPCYDRSRYMVRLVNLRGEDPACDVLRNAGVDTVSLNRSKFDLRVLGDVIREIKRWKPDLLHLHGYASFNFGRIAGKLSGVPVVIQEHFVDEQLPLYQKFADFILRKWQVHAMAVSEAVMRFMADERYIAEEGIEVLGNGVPLRELRERISACDRLEIKSSLGFPADCKVIGTLGRLAEMKGQRNFLDAAAELVERYGRDALRFFIVGDGPLLADLEGKAAESGIADLVYFAGYQEDIAPWLSILDVGVIPSIFGEGFCSVGLEILAARVPLVITDLPCFKDVYVADENVLMAAPGESSDIAESVIRLLEDLGLRQSLIGKAESTVEAYDINQIARRYTERYDVLSA
jgi:glycosyltransferase involved in cell wall biosynthesis